MEHLESTRANLEDTSNEVADTSSAFEAALPLNPTAAELIAASSGTPAGLAVDASRIAVDALLDLPDDEDSGDELDITDIQAQCDFCDLWCNAAHEPSLVGKSKLVIDSESFHCKVCRSMPGYSVRAEAAASGIMQEFSEATQANSTGTDRSEGVPEAVPYVPINFVSYGQIRKLGLVALRLELTSRKIATTSQVETMRKNECLKLLLENLSDLPVRAKKEKGGKKGK